MRRLFLGNFDFERVLSQGSDFPTDALTRLLAELAVVWIAVAESDDVVWCPEALVPEFPNHLQDRGFPHVHFTHRTTDLPGNLELVPWGWTGDAVQWGQRIGAEVRSPPIDVVKSVNSRRFSHAFESEEGLGLEGATVAESLSDLWDALRRLPSQDAGWVIKAEFSNSSRERFLCRGDRVADRDALARWAERRLRGGQALFIEPWVDRVDEAGVQIDIPLHGQPCLLGLTRLLVDGSGRYRGSEFTPAIDSIPEWDPAIATALEVAGHVQSMGYSGPLGIDAMRYRTATGEIRLRPVQDLNARWTMGRLSLGLRRFLQPGERGFWRHGPLVDHSPPPCTEGEVVREIITSPPTVGGHPVHLTSVLQIVADASHRAPLSST